MKYFNGFCLKNEKFLFKDYLEEGEFVVAGFSFGAQKALEYVLNANERIDKLQLLSPAFFSVNQKFIDINIKAFKKDKISYIKNFLTKAGIDKWKMNNGKWIIDNEKLKIKNEELIEVDYSCNEIELMEMFTFDWEKIQEVKDIKIEVFLGEYDKILSLKKAYEFFKNHATVYYIKKSNHFLRSENGY
jgi:pimeloyl-ACP methyl ester carboxylesterase